MTEIDVEKWNRKNQYKNFINYSNPVFSIGTTLEVTKLVSFCREGGLSFFSSFLYFVTISVNEISELNLRIKGDKVVWYEKTHPGYVVLCDNQELRTCITKTDDDFYRFYKATRDDISSTRFKDEVTAYNETVNLESFYVSNLPWITFTSVSNPYDLNDKEQTAIPRITWGKYYERGKKYIVDFNISAHHALVDGAQASRMICCLQDKLDSLKITEDTNER